MKTGAKYWRLKYRFMNIDPSLVKKETKPRRLLDAENTFETVALEWHEHSLAKWTQEHGSIIIHRLKRDIFPVIGKRPIKEITPLELLDAIKLIEKRGAHEMAHRALQMCGQVFRYALIMGKTKRNVALDIKGALKPRKQEHYRSLDPKRLPALLEAIESNEARLFAHTRLALKLMILTFVRTGELIGAKWEEIDWQSKLWLIPADV
jgi:integrase